MRLYNELCLLFFALVTATLAASSWSFEDATLTIQAKGSGVGGGVKEKYAGPFDALNRY